jgi:hypothetical protein
MDNTVKVYFDGPSGPIAPGSEVSVSVLVDAGSPLNIFNLAVTFPTDKLKFLGSDNTSSIVDIWKTKPSEGDIGVVEFSGGISSSFIGNNGLIVKLSFQVQNTATPAEVSKLSFGKGEFGIADGQGTRIIAKASDFSILVKENAQVVSEPFIPFQPTQSDILIEEGVKKIEAEQTSANSLTYLLISALIIFVICCVAVYNKTKHKL